MTFDALCVVGLPIATLANVTIDAVVAFAAQTLPCSDVTAGLVEGAVRVAATLGHATQACQIVKARLTLIALEAIEVRLAAALAS